MSAEPRGVYRNSRSRAERSGTPPDDLELARFAARQHGVVSRAQLGRCGIDDDATSARVARGRLHRIHVGVYAVGYEPLTLDARFMAAVLAGGPHAVLSHWASAAHAGLVRWRDDRLVDITVRSTRDRPGIDFHRARRLHPDDITRIRGIPTTTPARAILEIAPQLSDDRLKRLVRQAQAERRANVRQFTATLRRANGHRATKRLAALIATGPAATYSGHEDAVLDLILDAGFEHPLVNEQLRGTRYRPDFRWPAQRLVLEVDSPWHDGALARELDATRQADLEAAGERVLRTTLDQALRNPRQLAARLRVAGAPYTDRQP